MTLRSAGMDPRELFEQMENQCGQDLKSNGGRTWAYLYDHGKGEIDEVAKKAYSMFLSANGLDPTVFPSLVHFENDVLAIASEHLNGNEETVGSFTSGGTESILLAVKSARDYFHARKPEIEKPEMILPVTAHAAFHKAASYLGVTVVPTPVDPKSFRADVSAMEEAITPNTILLVGSAVSYAHGVVDPIRELGELALKKGLLFHVDGCIGAWLLPFYRRLGCALPDFDFKVPGVTSISMDFHKYAYCPKGASVVLYRNQELRKHQMFACAKWTGYSVINTTVQSSKSGGPLAAAWAVLNYLGDEGYMEIARRTLEASKKVIAGIQAIEDVYILGEPELCLVAFSSDTANVFHIVDEMTERGWYLQPQLSFGGSKENIHLSVTSASLDRVDDMLADLRECVEIAKNMAPDPMVEMARAALSQMDPAQLDDSSFDQLMALVGIKDGKLPNRMAGVHQIMNMLPPEMTERLLKAFFNDLFFVRA